MSEILTVRELLENVYNNLAGRNPHKEIILDPNAHTEIANDSDYHRSRTGSMIYERVNIFQFNKSWLVGRGIAGGGYPADPFDSDLLALEFSIDGKTPEQIQQELRDEIRKNDYFEKTIIFGMADGCLGVRKTSTFGERMFSFLQGDISKFIAQNVEHGNLYHMDLRPVVESAMKYKPELVDKLTEIIESLIKK